VSRPAVDTTTAREHLQPIPAAVLAAAARGEIDLNDLARQELASRGLDHDGKWVGFERAARLARVRYVWGPRGERVAVTTPAAAAVEAAAADDDADNWIAPEDREDC
jgi:hypothetical protein